MASPGRLFIHNAPYSPLQNRILLNFFKGKNMAQLTITNNWICRDLAVACILPPVQTKKRAAVLRLFRNNLDGV